MLKKFWEWIQRIVQRRPPQGTDVVSLQDRQQAWFGQCEPGCLVWARMPLPEDELAKIDPAHQIRPYLILAKTGNKLMAKACSSRPYASLREYQTVMLAKDRPLNKQTYLDLKQNYTLQAEQLQNKPIPLQRHDLRRIQKHLVLVSQLDHIYHPYLSVPLLWEKGDILEMDHVLWYLQEFVPGKLQLIRLYREYRSFMEDSGWNLFFCTYCGYFADFAHPVIFQGKTRLELVRRAASREIEYVDYCMRQGKRQHIKWMPGYIMKRQDEKYIVLSRTRKGWSCLEWHHGKKKWRNPEIRNFNGMECVGKVRRLKLKTLVASLLNQELLNLEELDPELLSYLGGRDQDWETLIREAVAPVRIKGVNRLSA